MFSAFAKSLQSANDEIRGLTQRAQRALTQMACKEGSLLMEQAMRLLGIQAEWQHVIPSTNLPINVSSVALGLTPCPTRSHCSTNETLFLEMNGPNVGEGCCLVDGKLYAAFVNQEGQPAVIGETGGIVNGRTAVSAAEHILLLLESRYTLPLQRWYKGSETDQYLWPCTVTNANWEPIP